MAAAAMEHRMIGHIIGPPARTISHIIQIPVSSPEVAGIIPDGPPASRRPAPECAVFHSGKPRLLHLAAGAESHADSAEIVGSQYGGTPLLPACHGRLGTARSRKSPGDDSPASANGADEFRRVGCIPAVARNQNQV